MKHSLAKRLIFFSITAILTISVIEIGLHLLAKITDRPKPETSNSLADSRLGQRPNPDFPGHDANGFRNSKVPANADIVVFGDSQSYGVGVALEENWPNQLQSLVNVPVYNMAFGGYGPAHSLMLWEEATAFKPSIIMEAFYAGNDLHDSFHLIYNLRQLEDLMTSNMMLRQRIRSMEKSDPIATHANRLYLIGTKVGSLQPEGSQFLLKYSKLYGLLQETRYEMNRRMYQPERKGEWENALSIVKANRESFDVFEQGAFKTVFTTEYRSLALNLADPRIEEGLQISLQSIRKMMALAKQSRIDFVVLLIPTKETVFSSHVPQQSSGYRNLIERERIMWNRTRTFLERNEIPYVDTLPALRKQFDKGDQPYTVTTDGHPNKYGHRAIAELAASYLSRER